MKIQNSLLVVAGLLTFGAASLEAQVVLISDDYNIAGNGAGFALDHGVNTGINPPATRLGGILAPNMSYILRDATKAASSYTITGSHLQVASAASSGRFSLSSDGSTPYDFGSALTSDLGTAAVPAVYDISISMANNAAGTQRFSFALGTAENNANFWDFGVQLYRANSADNFYTIQRRIDQVSYTTATDSTGNTGDINAAITTTATGTYGSMLNFTMRVTDAGAESTTFSSRVQLSMDGGATWFYDTDTDSALANGFRFDTASRYFSWDIAASAVASYDNFSVNLITPAPEPSVLAFGVLGVLGVMSRKRVNRQIDS